MALRWKYEPWRKLYLREEGSFAALPLMTRALAGELIKFADDDGRIHLGGKEPWDAIAMQGGADRNDRLVLRRHIQALLDDGYLVLRDGALWVRNLTHAQRRFDKVPATPEQDNDKTGAEPRQDSDKASTEPKQDLDKTSTEPIEVTPAHDTTFSRSDVTSKRKREIPLVRKHPLPADWQPSLEHAAEAVENGKSLAYEAKRFRNWAANADGKKDWNAAFSNWLSGRFVNGDKKPAAKGRDPAMAALDAAIAARSTS